MNRPPYQQTDPPMAEANAALEAILQAHLPYPALVVDRHWELVSANDAAFDLLDGIDADLLEPPVNVIRLSLHPRGLGPRIVNIAEWRAALAARLRREYDGNGDPALGELADEVAEGTTVFGRPREVTLSELAIEAFYPADVATRKILNGHQIIPSVVVPAARAR